MAGINERTARKTVADRDEKGAFRSRAQLTQVPGFGPKSFEQAAGFLRIRGGDSPLDIDSCASGVVSDCGEDRESLHVDIAALIAKPALVDSVKLEEFETERAGMYTLRDIREESRKPGAIRANSS